MDSAGPGGERTLSLAYRGLTEVSSRVADQFGGQTEYLDLSHNAISQLQFLARFDRLTSLVMDNNQLTSSSVPPPLPHLTTLWINHNQITELAPFLRALRYNCPSLAHLSLLGNPAVPALASGHTRGELYRYRIQVLTHFPRLVSLDQQMVERWERPDTGTLWAKVTSPDNWREVQRKVSVTASDVADKVSDTVGNGFDKVTSWWEARAAEADPARPPPPRNMIV